jgi:hypothetical protein
MWVIPHNVLAVVFGTSSQYATEGHGKGNFFLGQISRDPGPFFYPVAWLLRTTPLVLLGLLALGGVYLRKARSARSEERLPVKVLVGALLLYAGLFVVFMTLGEKKQDRYILPIYPVFSALAAVGLVHVANVKYQIPNSEHHVPSLQSLILVAILVLQGILVVANYPYYFTYYNPLMGGAPTAARVMTVGWGEGLDQAASYLNGLSDAEQFRVTSWYHNSLGPFFQGEATHYASDAGQTLSSDYAVVYRNQIQRELPTAELVRYLTENHTPVFTATMQGVDYVYVYSLPLVRRSDWQMSRLSGRVIFFGVGGAEADDKTAIDTGDESLSARLYWQNDGLPVSEEWWVALEPVTGPIQPWQACYLRSDFADERLMVGALLESECQLGEEGAPSGVYHLRVGVGPDPDQITIIPFAEGELAVVVEDGGSPHLVSRLTALDVLARYLMPQGAHPADLVYYGAVRLVGYTTESVLTAKGRHVQVHTYWQALEPLPMAELDQAVRVEIALLSPQGMVLTMTEGPFRDSETWPAVWSPGQVLTTTLSLPLPDSVPPQSQLGLNVLLNSQRQKPLDSSGEVVEPSLPALIVH